MEDCAMSYKTLLVQAEPTARGDDRVKLAADVAAMFEARVIGLASEGFFPVYGAGDAMATGAVIEAVRERIAADLPIAEQRFRDLTTSVAAGVEWLTGYDYPAGELIAHAYAADLMIASRPGDGSDPAFGAPAADLVLMSGTPVLFTASGGGRLSADTVLVAWKNTRECRRALADALPFLMRARKVTVVGVSGEATSVEQAALDVVARRLARHGVDVDTQVVAKAHNGIARTLEYTAAKVGADLIVMGAYGHSRVREWILGGATEDMLAASSRFVLFSH
jgi:nucleotide-binding universal stress UspA family protein